jgi:hypothetical protein
MIVAKAQILSSKAFIAVMTLYTENTKRIRPNHHSILCNMEQQNGPVNETVARISPALGRLPKEY